MSDDGVIGVRGTLAYGTLGFALAFVALPLYVVLPHHYASVLGAPLAGLGAVLLASRLADAFVDPWIGRLADRLFARSAARVLRVGALASLALFGGFVALFFPPALSAAGLLVWAAAFLAVTCIAFSALSVLHQAWGARLGGDDVRQSRLVGTREGIGLVGVVAAAVVPVTLGLAPAAALLGLALLLGGFAWRRAPVPPIAAHRAVSPMTRPFSRPGFRPLLAVFMANGIASAIPATLVLFFVEDRLAAPPSATPLFLGLYFVAAAAAVPLWLRLVRRIGLARTWLGAMGLSVLVFSFAWGLGAGDLRGFAIVCAFSGAALGADLALPGALLAGVIARAGDRGAAEGAYFGWWSLAAKLDLAVAAGAALPLLSLAGYAPGVRTPEALAALTAAYCLLPCALKLGAAALLYAFFVRAPRASHLSPPETPP